MINIMPEVVKYYVGRASDGKSRGSIFVSRGGDKWMRLPNKREHFWEHAMKATGGRAAKLESGEYVTFRTSCAACKRECYEDSPLEFLPTSVFYSGGSLN